MDGRSPIEQEPGHQRQADPRRRDRPRRIQRKNRGRAEHTGGDAPNRAVHPGSGRESTHDTRGAERQKSHDQDGIPGPPAGVRGEGAGQRQPGGDRYRPDQRIEEVVDAQRGYQVGEPPLPRQSVGIAEKQVAPTLRPEDLRVAGSRREEGNGGKFRVRQAQPDLRLESRPSLGDRHRSPLRPFVAANRSGSSGDQRRIGTEILRLLHAPGDPGITPAGQHADGRAVEVECDKQHESVPRSAGTRCTMGTSGGKDDDRPVFAIGASSTTVVISGTRVRVPTPALPRNLRATSSGRTSAAVLLVRGPG